jgi:hypothetical protein
MVVALAACNPAPPLAYRGFFDLPIARQVGSIGSLPPDQQLDIYVWAMTRVAPPTMALQDPVAKGGSRILPAALARIHRSTDRSEKEVLVELLAWMKCYRFDFSADSTTVRDLARDVASTDYGPRQALVQEAMDVIEGRRACAVSAQDIKGLGRELPLRTR